MLIQNIISWVAGHLDELFGLSQYLWLAVGLGLLLRLRVFRAAPLAAAPPRVSGFTVLTLAAAILLYCGTVFMSLAGASVAAQMSGAPAATAPATEAVTTTLPATMPRGNVAQGAASQAGTQAAGTEPATGPATQKVRVVYAESTSSILRGQLLNTFGEAVPAVVLVILAARMVVGGLDGWGLSLRKLPKGVGYGVLGFLAAMPLLMVVADITEYVIVHFQQRAEEVHETLQVLSRRPPVWEEAAFVLLAGVAAPMLEEIFFRGCVQTMLIQRRLGFTFQALVDREYRPTAGRRWLAIVLTSLFFAGMHPPDHCAVIFLLSVSLGYVYERTGNMWANITLHAAFNSFSIYFTLVSGS